MSKEVVAVVRDYVLGPPSWSCHFYCTLAYRHSPAFLALSAQLWYASHGLKRSHNQAFVQLAQTALSWEDPRNELAVVLLRLGKRSE